MPAPLVWTELADESLYTLRGEGRSWDAIAAVLGISRWAAIERGRLIGARKPDPAPPADAQAIGLREPMPAGHPVSWGAITAGTVLDGAAYPFPPPGPLEDEAPLGLAA
jgi:hypothetical protein